MSGLHNRYWRLFEENKSAGTEISAHVGGVGKDGHPDLYKPLKTLFKEWDDQWKKAGVKPKRKSRQ